MNNSISVKLLKLRRFSDNNNTLTLVSVIKAIVKSCLLGIRLALRQTPA